MAAPQILDNISALSTLMKTVYGPGVEQQQNLAAMLWKKFGQSQRTFGGNSYEFPARMVNTQSVGARGYNVGLPSPLSNTDVTARVRHKFVYGTFDIAGPDIEKGKGNVNAFVNTLTDKMRSLSESVLKDLNMQMYLDGSGVRATVASVVLTEIIVDQIKYLRVGMHVNIIASDGVTVRGAALGDSDFGDTSGLYFQKRFTIVGIDASTRAVQLASETAGGNLTNGNLVTIGVAAGDFIVRHKAAGAELIGIGAIVDDGVNDPAANILQDIDRTVNPLWRAAVLSSSTGPRDLTLQLMQIGIDRPEIVSGRRIDMLLGSYNARDRYLQLLVPQKRFTDLKMDGGFQVLEYNGRDFLVDVDCPDDQIFFLNRASIEKFGLFDLQFVEQTGGILKHDNLSSGDVFYGFMRLIANIGTTQANANAKITDLIVADDYIVNQ